MIQGYNIKEALNRGRDMLDKRKNYYIQRFGVKFKQLRAQKGISRRELSEKTGYIATYIAKIEDGTINNPSDEVKEKLCEGLGVTKKEKEYLMKNACLQYYTESDEVNLKISVPEYLDFGGEISRNMLLDYMNGISDKGMFALMYCAQTIYNAENPEEVEKELKKFNEAQDEYSKKWRRAVNKKTHDKINDEFENALNEYILNKIEKGTDSITLREATENVSVKKSPSYVTKVVNRMCEDGLLKRIGNGKYTRYMIEKEKFKKIN